MTSSIRGILSAIVILLPMAALAQTEPAGMMPEVVVTADRFPTDPDKITASYTVITNEEMQRRQLRNASDVLKTVPGVSVQQSGGPGTQTSILIRGSNSDHTLVLIDGITANDPSSANGAIDFAHFLTENLDRIEVVRGPMSTLYGSQAIGGVVNLVTKAGKGPMNGAAYTELGTRLWSNSGAYVRGSEGRFNYNITLAGMFAPNDTVTPARFWANSANWVDNDPYRNLTAAGRFGIEINDNTQLNWFTRYIDTQVKFDNFGFNGPTEDPNATEFTQQFYNRLELNGSYFDGRWKPVVGINYTSIYRHDQDFPSFQNPFPFTMDSYFNGRRLQADFKNLITITDQLDLIAGIDYDQQWAYNNADGLQGWGAMAQTGYYGQVRVSPFAGFNLNVGGRVDTNDTFGTVTTWRAGASYLWAPTDSKVKASYGTAFKAPSLFELYGAGFFCAGNRNLQPEYSRGSEIGLEQGFFDHKITAGFTYFYNNYSNLIQCPPPFVNLQNVNNAHSEGVEVFLHASPLKWLDFHFEYTYLIARNDDLNQPLVRRPGDTFNVRAEVRPWDNVLLGFGLLQVSQRTDFDAVTGAIMSPSPYTLIRFTAAYDVRKNVQLFARAENVLNVVYEEPEGFQAPFFQAFFGVKAKF